MTDKSLERNKYCKPLKDLVKAWRESCRKQAITALLRCVDTTDR